MSASVDATVDEIDAAMRVLRARMRGIPIRYAGFKKEHDALARAVSALTVTLLDAKPAISREKKRRRVAA